jgi:hypothetical protein
MSSAPSLHTRGTFGSLTTCEIRYLGLTYLQVRITVAGTICKGCETLRCTYLSPVAIYLSSKRMYEKYSVDYLLGHYTCGNITLLASSSQNRLEFF